MSAAPAAATESKRGPGRPPKKMASPLLRMDGVVENPTDPQNRLEFVYGDPAILKSLFAYFKNLRAVDVHIRCAPGGLTFFTRDSGEMCRVVAEIPGEKINHFYCEGTFWLGLNRESVERIFSSVDRSFFKVTLLHRHDDEESLTIIFKDPDIDKECHYRVTVSSLNHDEQLLAAEPLTRPEALGSAPIAFQLTAKQFKKTVTDASHYSASLTFEKIGAHPLQLTYTRIGLIYNEVYHAPERICLRSAVGPDEIFRCTVSIAHIKALASAMVTDHVRIFCREDGELLLRSELDPLTLSTLTAID